MENGLGGFGDTRLERGGIFLMERLIAVGQDGISVRALGGDRAGEIRLTRFLRNDDVTPKEMLETAARTATRVGGRHILVIQACPCEGGGHHQPARRRQEIQPQPASRHRRRRGYRRSSGSGARHLPYPRRR
jgi:hypothetical protein